MKLLFDNNLASRATEILKPDFPEVRHVSHYQLQRASDVELWNFASENDFAIVSKDSDLHQLSLVQGHPPKLIWLRVGNCSTRNLIALIRKMRDEIETFLADDDASFLVID